MKILLASSEVTPFAKTGGLADVSGALPKAINRLDKNNQCIIVMPLYQLVGKNGFKPEIVKKDIKIPLGGVEYSFNLGFLQTENSDVYFIDNKQFYDRKELYNTPQGDYPDNHLRFAFFSNAILSVADFLGDVDIIHCNDWQTALLPLYIKLSKNDRTPKTLFTIHNMAYQGVFDKNVMMSVDLPQELFTPEHLEFYGRLSFMKAGIIYSDAISTVSKGYAKEILTEEFGCGLDGLLRKRKTSVFGITNGVDYANWNPKTDKYIAANYDIDTLSRKQECKKDLLDIFGLSFDERKPVMGVITRLAEQKGIDIIADSLEKMFSLGIYFVLLGTGDEKYNNLFNKLSKKYAKSAGIRVAFDNALAHKIEAGADMFLMPSRYEPCGLNQMYSLKYATIPVVRATGGLEDTIEDFDPETGRGNGFKFKQASVESFYDALKRATQVYKDKEKWQSLQKKAMQYDFSWDKSAKEYLRLYNKILDGDI